jgi:hypothetical protein
VCARAQAPPDPLRARTPAVRDAIPPRKPTLQTHGEGRQVSRLGSKLFNSLSLAAVGRD